MARPARHGSRADTALLIACVLLAFIARVLPANVRDPLASGLRRSVVAPFVAMHAQSELARNAWKTYGKQTAARDSLVLEAGSVHALQSENDRLRKLLGLGTRLRWGFVPAEALHDRARIEEFTLSLTSGSRAGIKPYSPVVAPEGLVGMVQTADPDMALAILWTHPDFRVSAMSSDGTAFGIVSAHLGDAPERYLLEMRGVPFRSQLAPGTVIVSAGLGGVYPRGIPVGRVLRELTTAEGWARTYLLEPAVLPPNVMSVMVLSPERVVAGTDGIWTIANADSASRAVVAAGDSLARATAAAEAAARRQATAAAQDTTPVAVPAPPVTAPAPRRDSVRTPAPVRRDTAPAPTPVRRDTSRQAPPPPAIRPPPSAIRPIVPPRTDSARPVPVPARTDTARPPVTPPPPVDTARPPAPRDTNRPDTTAAAPGDSATIPAPGTAEPR